MEDKQHFLTSVWNKVLKYSKTIGQKTVYAVLLMFYAFRRQETPGFARSIIIGTLGYFLSPIDALPDLTPVLGYTDDLGVLSFGLVAVASYINDEVRINARKAMKRIFQQVDIETLQSVDQKL